MSANLIVAVVLEWLEHPKRARWHLHFTPTSSSWLNLVEGWFAQLTNRRLRNATFDSVAVLTEAIDLWASHWNDDPKPFVWHQTGKSIVAKVRRGRAALTTTPNPRHTTSVLRQKKLAFLCGEVQSVQYDILETPHP